MIPFMLGKFSLDEAFREIRLIVYIDRLMELVDKANQNIQYHPLSTRNKILYIGYKVCLLSLTPLLFRNSNVSHMVIMKPNAAGYYNVSWAKVTYSSPESSEQVSLVHCHLGHSTGCV